MRPLKKPFAPRAILYRSLEKRKVRPKAFSFGGDKTPLFLFVPTFVLCYNYAKQSFPK